MDTLIKRNHISTASFLAEGIDDFIGALREKLFFLISTQVLDGLDYQGKQMMARSLISSSDNFISAAILNARGDEFIKTYHRDFSDEARLESHSGSHLFERARQEGSSISGIYRENSLPRMDIIYSSGNEYVFVTLNLSSLFDKIIKSDIGPESEVFLVDGGGFAIAHSDKDYLDRKINIPTVNAVIERMGSGSMEYEEKGEDFVGAYASSGLMDWGVVTAQKSSVAYAPADRARKDAVLWIIAAGILASAGAFFMAKGLSGPILKLASCAEKVAGGDFDNEVDIKTKDELQVLAASFNQMQRALKKYNELQIDRIIEERTKTKAIIFSIEDGIIMTDDRGGIMLVNEKARELLEISKDPIEGESIFNYVERRELEDLFNNLKEIELDFSSEGRNKVIKTFKSEVKTPGGKKLGKMIIARDISLEKEIEKIKENFIHSITHDLKNPLSAIIGMSDLLKSSCYSNLKEEEKEYFSILKGEALRLMGMINDILNLAKIESGKMKIDRNKLDIGEMLQQITRIFEVNAKNDGIELVNSAPCGINIYGDEKLLRRVVINLLGNALKYTPSGGRVELNASLKGNYAECSVSDTGEGIPADIIDSIFDKFQQAGGRSKGGTGIGLNVSKEIVKAHGGRIWVNSRPDKGSEFKFTLPVNDA